MVIYQSPLETDEEYVKLLGLVSARWSMMEEALAHLLGVTLDNFDTGYAIYFSVSSFRQRIELIKSVAQSELTETAAEQVSDVVSQVYDAFKDRNRMIHEPYHAMIIQDGELMSAPTLWNEEALDLKWIGQGPYHDPRRINKGAFNGHLEKLDRLIGGVVWEIDHVKNLAIEQPEE